MDPATDSASQNTNYLSELARDDSARFRGRFEEWAREYLGTESQWLWVNAVALITWAHPTELSTTSTGRRSWSDKLGDAVYVPVTANPSDNQILNDTYDKINTAYADHPERHLSDHFLKERSRPVYRCQLDAGVLRIETCCGSAEHGEEPILTLRGFEHYAPLFDTKPGSRLFYVNHPVLSPPGRISLLHASQLVGCYVAVPKGPCPCKDDMLLRRLERVAEVCYMRRTMTLAEEFCFELDRVIAGERYQSRIMMRVAGPLREIATALRQTQSHIQYVSSYILGASTTVLSTGHRLGKYFEHGTRSAGGHPWKTTHAIDQYRSDDEDKTALAEDLAYLVAAIACEVYGVDPEGTRGWEGLVGVLGERKNEVGERINGHDLTASVERLLLLEDEGGGLRWQSFVSGADFVALRDWLIECAQLAKYVLYTPWKHRDKARPNTALLFVLWDYLSGDAVFLLGKARFERAKFRWSWERADTSVGRVRKSDELAYSEVRLPVSHYADLLSFLEGFSAYVNAVGGAIVEVVTASSKESYCIRLSYRIAGEAGWTLSFEELAGLLQVLVPSASEGGSGGGGFGDETEQLAKALRQVGERHGDLLRPFADLVKEVSLVEGMLPSAWLRVEEASPSALHLRIGGDAYPTDVKLARRDSDIVELEWKTSKASA